MLIKATRIRTATGARALARHLLQGDENEAIVVVRGTVADLHDAVADAKRFNRLYALRHIVIAPEVAMDRQQFERAAQALGDEFGFDPALALVVEHQKSRAVAGVSDRHWHLVVAETDAATGRVLSSRFSHPRHEKIGRLLELEFGHPIVPGAHDIAVLATLRGEGRNELADRIAAALGQGPKPVSAYSVEAHQAGKRIGVDLAQARQHIRLAWASSTNGDDFRSRLAGHGLELAAGEKPGVVIIRDRATGMVLGAANRLAGIRRADFNNIMERNAHDDQQPANHAQRRTDDPGRNGHSEARSGYHPRTGEGDSVADEGRVDLRDRRDVEPIAEHRDAGGGQQQKLASSPSEAGRARAGAGLAPGDGQRLIAVITTSGTTMLALAKSISSITAVDQTRQNLAGMEAAARSRIGATEAKANDPVPHRLYVARLYRDGTDRRHAEAVQEYRAAQERLTAVPETKQSFIDRLLGRPQPVKGTEKLERELSAARDNLIAADHLATSAMARLARIEREETAARIERMSAMETERRAGLEMLSAALMAQRMVRYYPALVYSGPTFAAWAGRKIERKRRKGLRNPNARNIWGLPIEP